MYALLKLEIMATVFLSIYWLSFSFILLLLTLCYFNILSYESLNRMYRHIHRYFNIMTQSANNGDKQIGSGADIWGNERLQLVLYLQQSVMPKLNKIWFIE